MTSGSGGEAGARVIEHEQVLATARRMFVRDGHLDMHELTRELAVSRATLYRVVSSRERLLGDVLWSLAAIALEEAVADETSGDPDLERLLRVGARFRESVLAAQSLRSFVRAEPSAAAAALFTPSEMRTRVAGAWKRLLVETIGARDEHPVVDAEHAAEIIVSLGASVLYARLVTDDDDDVDLVAVVLRSLFAPAP